MRLGLGCGFGHPDSAGSAICGALDGAVRSKPTR